MNGWAKAQTQRKYCLTIEESLKLNWKRYKAQLRQVREQYLGLREAKLKAGRKALGGRYIDVVNDQVIDMTLHLLKHIIDGKWYNSVQLTAVSGWVIRPEMAAREDPIGKYNIGRGRNKIVTRELQDLMAEKRIAKRRGDGRTDEWRLVDRAWAKQVLAKTTEITV